MTTRVALFSGLILLSGCTTASFAPPDVDRSAKLLRVPSATCISERAQANNADVAIQFDVIGAFDLIQNFEMTYSCAADEAANGRQVFEVPSFLATAAGLAGASFGLGADQILVTGVSAAVLNGGKSYYAPKEKAGVLHAAIGAVNCIRTEAVGISYFRTRADSESSDPVEQFASLHQELQAVDAKRAATKGEIAALKGGNGIVASGDQLMATQLDTEMRALDMMRGVLVERLTRAASRAAVTGGIEIDAERQYFEMVKGALSAVHGIVGERLRDAGDAELQGTYAKLKELVKEDTEEEKPLDDAQTADENATTAFIGVMNSATAPQALALAQQKKREAVRLENEHLQTRLQICVLQARVD